MISGFGWLPDVRSLIANVNVSRLIRVNLFSGTVGDDIRFRRLREHLR